MKTPEKLTAKAVAERMNGREYLHEITDEEGRELARSGLVVVFGYSDDNVELRGSINDEIGCWESGKIPILNGEVFVPPCGDKCLDHDCQLLRDAYRRSVNVIAEFTSTGWKFDGEFPHETFTIMEEGEEFGQGIVFAMEDLKYENA